MSLSLDQTNILFNEMILLVMDNNLLIRHGGEKIQKLLEHAVQMLNESFFSVNQEIKPIDDKSSPSENATDLHKLGLLGTLQKALSIANNLNQMLSKTTQSLQVEDIISQIVAKIDHRTIKTDEIIQSIQAMYNSKLDVSEFDFNCIVEKIRMMRVHPSFESLQQNSLDEGGFELF